MNTAVGAMQPARILTIISRANPEAALFAKKLKTYENGVPNEPRRRMMMIRAPQAPQVRKVSFLSRPRINPNIMEEEIIYSFRSHKTLDAQKTPCGRIFRII